MENNKINCSFTNCETETLTVEVNKKRKHLFGFLSSEKLITLKPKYFFSKLYKEETKKHICLQKSNSPFCLAIALYCTHNYNVTATKRPVNILGTVNYFQWHL